MGCAEAANGTMVCSTSTGSLEECGSPIADATPVPFIPDEVLNRFCSLRMHCVTLARLTCMHVHMQDI